MNTKGVTIGVYIVLAVVVIILVITNFSQAGCHGLYPKLTVEIVNDIGSGINVPCKSKNDDLGIHYIAPGQAYSFNFRPHIFGVTLFYCSTNWNGRTEYFDAFDGRHGDEDVCKNNDCVCFWKLSPDKYCFVDKYSSKPYDFCKPWKPKLKIALSMQN
uniref:S-protein homolog n=1 Tax=Kalanchoe fedtschenkoi TaxID=63787 RepID=A0A7N0TN45_KALFE